MCDGDESQELPRTEAAFVFLIFFHRSTNPKVMGNAS